MTQFRLPDQVPASWGRVDQSGEGGTKAARIDGSGLDVRNYMMHRLLLPAPADVSLQTRISAKLIGMTVGNPAFEGAAVLHRGFRMQGTEPNLELDEQVWSSNPAAGGRKSWISGDHSDFRTYNFVEPLPKIQGMDYVTWELVVRSPGQIIVDDVQCRHYYGKAYNEYIEGTQRWNTPVFQIHVFDANFNGKNVRRWIKSLRTQAIECRKGQNLIFMTEVAALDGIGTQFTPAAPANQPCSATRGFLAKLRRSDDPGVYDYFDLLTDYTGEQYNPVKAAETRSFVARHSYDQWELYGFIDPKPDNDASNVGVLFIEHKDVNADLVVADFVAPSQ